MTITEKKNQILITHKEQFSSIFITYHNMSQAAYNNADEASKKLREYTKDKKGAMGLVNDDTKFNDTKYKELYKDFHRLNDISRNISKKYSKEFKKEIRTLQRLWSESAST